MTITDDTSPALDLASAEEALGHGPVVVAGRWDVVTMAGADAAGYLQGQLSQQVESIKVGASAWTFLLQPQGKVDVWGRVVRVGEEAFWFVVDAGWGAHALARLERFKLRVQVDMEWGPRSGLAVRGLGAAQVHTDGAVVVDAAWGGAEGVDLIPSSPGDADLLVPSGPAVGPADLLTVLRCREGRPAMGSEIDESTIPAAVRVVNRSADFTKGCYVGQELVARVDSRGQNTPTRLCRLSADQPITAGAALLGADGQAAGSVTTVADSPTWGHLGLGFVGRKVAADDPITAEDGSPVRFEELVDHQI